MRILSNRWKVIPLFASMATLAFLSAGCGLFGVFQHEPEAFPAVRAEEPRIRPGLAVRIIISAAGKTDAQDIVISPVGEVTLPLVGTIKCAGLTVQELQEKIKTACNTYYLNPQVTVQFLFGPDMQSPWGTVQVQGQVNHAGPVNIPQTRDLTVTRALQLAGGVTVLGNQAKVQITRKLPDGKGTRTKSVNLEQIGKGKTEDDILLQADDGIFVPEIRW